MDMIFNELINVLDQEFNIYSDIYKISKEKTTVIVEGKVDELEKMVQAEQKLIIKVTQIENQREIITYKISKALQMKLDEITLSALIDNAEGPVKDKLKERQQGLKKLVSKLVELNDLNSRLIKNSLDYIDFSINLCSASKSQDNNYGIDAEKSNVKVESRFDFKI
ncbi:FlgN family protein [Pseudobacteroides cellulosolvens ATCC 35603 = DSM 2933]|uniref:FlgN family protein n=2 Tax=Pseudobacteroides cellulosolvens TaxID=35825 RepID=A0A0L6JSD0_9FIRM|nr:FlgN family protein [Pseudobacteroides cellulosolvens ATCC 35603 = DSM 2933]